MAEALAPLFSEMHKSSSEALPSDDPLDSPSFNAVQFINERFSNEQSLTNAEDFMKQLRSDMAALDEEMNIAVQQQSGSGEIARRDLSMAQASAVALMARVSAIKATANDAESSVHVITGDIRCLDRAKRNLTTSITALRRLQMLQNAVEQVDAMASKQQYRDAAMKVEAVQQLMTHFDSFAEVGGGSPSHIGGRSPDPATSAPAGTGLALAGGGGERPAREDPVGEEHHEEVRLQRLQRRRQEPGRSASAPGHQDLYSRFCALVPGRILTRG